MCTQTSTKCPWKDTQDIWEQVKREPFSYSSLLLPFHKNNLKNLNVLSRDPWASCNSYVLQC